jgi:ketosteroid isomerase-like protein
MNSTFDLAAMDRRIDELATKAELTELGDLLADDFIYVHSTGKRDDKESWLQSLRPLRDKRVRVASGIEVDFHGDVAIAMGDLDVIWNDGRIAKNRYVRVYRRAAEAWSLIQQRTLPAPDR